MRIFGPFCRDFLVPWSEITVTRSDRVVWKVAKLSFGSQKTAISRCSRRSPIALRARPVIIGPSQDLSSRNRKPKLFENRQAVGSNDRPRGCFFYYRAAAHDPERGRSAADRRRDLFPQ